MITELIDHKLQLMRQGEKTMIIQHSSADSPKNVSAFLEGCNEFFLCYLIDLRVVQKTALSPALQAICEKNQQSVNGVKVVKPPRPEKPVKPARLSALYSQKAIQEAMACEGDGSSEGGELAHAGCVSGELSPVGGQSDASVCESGKAGSNRASGSGRNVESDSNRASGNGNRTVESNSNRASGNGSRTSGNDNRTSGNGSRTSGNGNRTVESNSNRASGNGSRTSGNDNRTSGNGSRTSGNDNRTSGNDNNEENANQPPERSAPRPKPPKPAKPVKPLRKETPSSDSVVPADSVESPSRSPAVRSPRTLCKSLQLSEDAQLVLRKKKSSELKQPPALPPKPPRGPPQKPPKPHSLIHPHFKPVKPVKPAQFENYHVTKRTVNSPSSDSVTGSSCEE